MPTINFNMEKQEHSDWCWAAVAVSVERHFDPDSTWCQCRIATRMAKMEKLTVKDCGNCRERRPAPRACNRTWYLDKALRLVGRLAGKPRVRALSFALTARKIHAGRPVCARIQWGPGPSAHFVVVTGSETAKSGSQWVDVEDPFAGSSTWLYDEFRSNYQYSQGQWTDTYPV
jgi:hypothetical protein